MPTKRWWIVWGGELATLVTPIGHMRSKEQLLGEIASGTVKFLVWEPESIAVRIDGELAILRYRAQFEIKPFRF